MVVAAAVLMAAEADLVLRHCFVAHEIADLGSTTILPAVGHCTDENFDPSPLPIQGDQARSSLVRSMASYQRAVQAEI